MSPSPETPVDKLVALVNERWRYRLAAMTQTARDKESMDGLRARRAEIRARADRVRGAERFGQGLNRSRVWLNAPLPKARTLEAFLDAADTPSLTAVRVP